MNIGEFRHLITIKKQIVEQDINGFEIKKYDIHATLWAKVSNLHGKEFFEAAAIQKEKTVKFTIRSVKTLDETMKIEFQGKLYDIIFIDNIKYENKYMEIKAIEVSISG
ncbi:SPP1 family predicted phage head-tail adaptor [Acetoanaerobium pronyense]|uniref:SPP1 family predicted phage head-tail adaptor n=1 Tax=Acetoanaerobium pronyense TaxID=1482736 RepID=A0ABS4KLN1_9FIRM|nr:phage head closure protein [Acetoanaerobium pronyense]MBP2028697.1 SPP1 family predicted phage head-tail adaptor [Acetoanaerobium pronyense]